MWQGKISKLAPALLWAVGMFIGQLLPAQLPTFKRSLDNGIVGILRMVRFLDDGTVAFSGLCTDGVQFLDLDHLVLKPSVNLIEGRVHDFAFSPDRKHMLIATLEGGFSLYDLRQNRVIHKLGSYTSEHGPSYEFLHFAPGGKQFGARRGCSTYYWDCASGQLADSIVEPEHECMYDVRFAADGKTAFCGGNEEVWIYDRLGHQVTATNKLPDYPVVTSMAMRPDCGQLAVGTRDYLMLVDTGLLDWKRLPGPPSWLNEVKYAPDGKSLYACYGSFLDKDWTLRGWDVATGTSLGTLHGHQAEVEALDISPDGKWIASVSRDGTLKLWRRAEMALALTVVPMRTAAGITFFCFTPHGLAYGDPAVSAHGNLYNGDQFWKPVDTQTAACRKAVIDALKR